VDFGAGALGGRLAGGGGGAALAGLGHFGLSIFLLGLSRCAPWKIINP
jgi:hypothetical protein